MASNDDATAVKTRPKPTKRFFTDGADLPHSRIKRSLFRSILQAFFGMYLHVESFSFYQCRVFDPFSGAGSYSSDELEFDPDDPLRYGTPIVAIHTLGDRIRDLEKSGYGKGCDNSYRRLLRQVALDGTFHSLQIKDEAETKTVGECKVAAAKEDEGRVVHTCHFIFNDVKPDHVERLKNLVFEKFRSMGWKSVVVGGQDCVETHEFSYFSEALEKNLLARVDFYCKPFQKFEVDKVLNGEESLTTALFSCVDPFGSGIPFEIINKLVGKNMFLFIIFMVQNINRFWKSREEEMTKVFGHSAFKTVYQEAGEKPKEAQAATDWSNRNLLNLCKVYQEQTLETCGARSAAFAFRKGKTAPDKDTLFYAVFAATSLSALQRMKSGFQRHLQAPALEMKDLAFSDYFFHNQVSVELGRKTTNEEEAEVIYEAFKGQQVTLGKLRAYIILKTPFVYHSRALRNLEKSGKIVEVDVSRSNQERIKKSFMSKVPHNEDSDEEGNLWIVKFA